MGQPRRTPSRLGFKESKNNKYKPSRQDGEPSAQVVDRSFPPSNLLSLAQIYQGNEYRSNGGEGERGTALGSLFSDLGFE